jgi:hypothetical protein
METYFERSLVSLKRADIYSHETEGMATLADFGHVVGPDMPGGVIINLDVDRLSVDVNQVTTGLITLAATVDTNITGIGANFDLTPAAARELAAGLVRAAEWLETER